MKLRSSLITLLIGTIGVGCSSGENKDAQKFNTQGFDTTAKGSQTVDTIQATGGATTQADTTAIDQTGIKAAPDTSTTGLKKPQPAKHGKWPTQGDPFG